MRETSPSNTSQKDIRADFLNKWSPIKMSADKRKHVTLNLKEKLEIVEALQSGEPRSSLAARYRIGMSTVADINKRKAIIRAYAASLDSEDAVTTRKSMKKSNHEELEEAVYMWLKEMRVFGRSITGPLICEKALVFNDKLNGDPNFKASHGWLHRFKARRGIDLDSLGKKSDSNDVSSSAEVPPRAMLNDEDIIRRCLVAVKTEETSGNDNDARDGDVNQDLMLDSSTGFIRRKKRKKPAKCFRSPKHPKQINDNIDEMKKRKLALEIEQLELRNHLCTIEIFQAEKRNFLPPSVYTEQLHNHRTPPITEVYLENGDTGLDGDILSPAGVPQDTKGTKVEDDSDSLQ